MAIGELCADTDWGRALKDVQTIVHLAARVHVMGNRSTDPLNEFRRVNVDGTLNLVLQAAATGVRRLVFLSTIKVNGEKTLPGQLFSEDDRPSPKDPYAISKLEAEQCLLHTAKKTGIEVVIIRPPLVYGPGVKANFRRMMCILERGLPLPFGAVTENRRSLLGIDNLIDLLCLSLRHPAAANRVLVAADGEDLSTSALLHRLAQAMGVQAHLVRVPPILLAMAASLIGQRAVAQRLLGNLQVNIHTTRELLGWRPALTVEQGLQRTVQEWPR